MAADDAVAGAACGELDPPARRPSLAAIEGFTIRHQASSTASALLLAGWLASPLHWDTRPLMSANGSGMHGRAYTRSSRYIDIGLETADQDVPGLAGITVTAEGYALSLDRAEGGLRLNEAIAGTASTAGLCWGRPAARAASRGRGPPSLAARPHLRARAGRCQRILRACRFK